MAEAIIMPRLGNTVESCVIVSWKVKEGDTVKNDTVVCDIETDKATMEVPAGVSGTVLKLLYKEGDEVPVLKTIAVVGKAGEDWKSLAANASDTASTSPSSKETAEPILQHSPDEASIIYSNIAISPRAKALAESKAIDIASIKGRGPNGRIVEQDVLSAINEISAKSALVSSSHASTANVKAVAVHNELGSYIDTELKSVRKIIADRMMESIHNSAQLTLHSTVQADRILSLRARFRDAGEAIGLADITIGDIVLYAVSRVLPLYPALNAHIVKGVLRSYKHVHLGVAIDTPRGLMVPVVRNAETLSLKEISTEVKRLAAACINNKANPDELSGSTFTVSNLGAFGIESFTPIINTPEAGILGLGSIIPRVCMNDGNIGFEKRLGLSLTIDHRALDGADGARFIKSLSDILLSIDIAIAK